MEDVYAPGIWQRARFNRTVMAAYDKLLLPSAVRAFFVDNRRRA